MHNRGFVLAGMCLDTANPCGSEPARDGGVSGDIDAGCDGLIASRLAPTGIGGGRLFLGLVQQSEKPLPHLHMITVRHVEPEKLIGIRRFAEQGSRCQYPVSYTHLTLPTNREV